MMFGIEEKGERDAREEAGKTLAQTSRARGSPSIGWPGSLLVVLSLVESWSIARRLGVLPAIKPRPPDATNRILLGVSGATKRTAQPHHGAQKVAHDRRREKSNKDANEPPHQPPREDAEQMSDKHKNKKKYSEHLFMHVCTKCAAFSEMSWGEMT